MKILLLLCLAWSLAADAAWAIDRSLAREWERMPRDARAAYMAGAVTGLKVFNETQGGKPGQVTFVVEQAVAAMDQLTAEEFNQSLPMMAVAAAALDVALGRDPAPRLAIGHMLVNPDDPMNRLYAAPSAAQSPETPTPPAAARRRK